MAQIIRMGMVYDIVFIDPSATTSGTGETIDSPLNTFPTLSDGKCYLIRRTQETYMVNMPIGKFSTLYNICFMGMPKPDDEDWDLFDDAIQTAWGYDSADYANVRWKPTSFGNNTSYSFYPSSANNIYFSRCYMFRDTTSPSAQSYMNTMIYIDNSNTSLSFNYCKFGFLGIDLEDENWCMNNTFVANRETTNYSGNKMRLYLYAPNIKDFEVKNSIINYCRGTHYITSSIDHYRATQAFYMQYVDNINFYNNKLNCVYSYYTENNENNSYNTLLYVNNRCTYKFKFNKNEINYFFNSNWSVPPYVAYGFSSYSESYLSTAELKDNVFYCKKLKDSYPSGWYSNCGGITIYGYKSFDIDTMVADFSKTGGIYAPHVCLKLLRLFNCYAQGAGLQTGSVKNIDFKFALNGCMPSSGIVNTYPLDIYRDSYAYMGYDNYQDRGGSEWQVGNSFSIPVLSNINIYCPRGYGVRLTRMHMVKSNITGLVNLVYGAGAEIDKLVNWRGNRSGIHLEDSWNYIRVKDYEVVKDNPTALYTGAVQVTSGRDSSWFYGNSSVYIDKSNCGMFGNIQTDNTRTTIYNQIACCPNMINDGQYVQICPQGSIKSWNVVRDGSTSQASLKFEKTGSSTLFPVVLGQMPYNGLQILPTKLGQQKVKVYMASVGFNPFDPLLFKTFRNNCMVEVIVPDRFTEDGNLLTNKIYHTDNDGSLLTDNSTWTPESNCVSMVFEVPVEVKSLEKPIEIKVHYNYANSGGCTYLDPDIKIED